MNSQNSALEYLHVLLLHNTVTAESCNKRPATNKRLLSPRALNRINTVDALQRPVTTVPELKDCQLTIGIANRTSIIKRPTFIQWPKVRRTVFSTFWTSRPIGFSVERYKHFYDPWMTLAFHITKKKTGLSMKPCVPALKGVFFVDKLYSRLHALRLVFFVSSLRRFKCGKRRRKPPAPGSTVA